MMVRLTVSMLRGFRALGAARSPGEASQQAQPTLAGGGVHRQATLKELSGVEEGWPASGPQGERSCLPGCAAVTKYPLDVTH